MRERRTAREAKVAQPGRVLTEAQVVASEKAKADKNGHGKFASKCSGSCGAQDTLYVRTRKGVDRISQQTFIDTHSKVGFAKLYDRNTPRKAADLLNDRAVPFFEAHGVPLRRVLAARGTEYCGQPDRHEDERYVAGKNIDHTWSKTTHPQTNGICVRFNKTVLNELSRVAFRKTLYPLLEELQAISRRGCGRTMSSGRTRAGGAMGRDRCRPSWTACRWRRRRCWPYERERTRP